MKDRKIELASQDEVDYLESYIDIVLEALGHPEALVTDESYISDFLCVCNKEEAEKELAEASSKLDLTFEKKDSVVSVARRLRNEGRFL